ncbi:S8 family peptidase [Clostridium ihumii]|uniref:S8 family peptidase n=1 Tax=Clostridium ihumii TaxID=1470356 RepID=UPI00058B408A|nr:S8 family peptidase [Clostridium ihumii]
MGNKYLDYNEVFSNPSYKHYIVQYEGDIESDFKGKEGYSVTIINANYAIVSLKKNLEIEDGDPKFPSIVYIKRREIYTLESISPVQAANVQFLQSEVSLNLTGRNVVIGMIDTGIDYLNDEFKDKLGDTRIECIWDQTINTMGKDNNTQVPYGTLYEKSEIRDAIKNSKEGLNPYDIVPSKDEIGHGTNMAGIIGGNGSKTGIVKVAPECKFAVVKLIESANFKEEYPVDVPVYNIVSIFTALQFLYDYAIDNNVPMVIYIPLGTNSGNHRGSGILEEYIDQMTSVEKIVVVTGAGNEGVARGHTSGNINSEGEISVIQLNVSPEQKSLIIEIWVDCPNIMSLDIVSPSGENTGFIPAPISLNSQYSFIFEKTNVKIKYFIPEETSGDELILVEFSSLQPGIWKMVLTGELIVGGRYNAWITYTGQMVKDTYFSPCDPYGTITNPATASYIITVAAYNQDNNNVVKYSGMANQYDYMDRIDIAAGGVNALTVGPNNKIEKVNGTSVAAAIVAGTCALILQWGVEVRKDIYMNAQTIRYYIIGGASKRSGDIYPNPQWGYGKLDVLGIFENMI